MPSNTQLIRQVILCYVDSLMKIIDIVDLPDLFSNIS